MKRQWHGVQPDEHALRETERLERQEIEAILPRHGWPESRELQEWRRAMRPGRTSLMAEDGQVTPQAALGVSLRVLWAEPGSLGDDNRHG